MKPTAGLTLVAVSCAIGVAGCGPDVVGGAATTATVEATAAKQAEAQKAKLEADLKAAQDATQRQAADIGKKADEASQ